MGKITLQQNVLGLFKSTFIAKIIKLALSKIASAKISVASNLAGRKCRVISKNLCLMQLTSNLLSPFPFRSTNHTGADAFHHKPRRTSTGTRTSLHCSLTAILSRFFAPESTSHDTTALNANTKK